MKVQLSQHERTRLYRLLAVHQADALTLHRVKELMDRLADWPESWDQACTATRLCKINPDLCPHRDAEIIVSNRAAKVILDMLTSMSKGNRLVADQISLVAKFAPELLPDGELGDDEKVAPNP